jgi:hypothetical protein
LTESQYKTLCKSCDKVLNMDHLGSALIALPWLHVIREHPIFLNEYEEIYSDKKGNNVFAFLKSIALDFLLNSRFIIESSLRFYKKPALDTRRDFNSDFLFISHLINDSQVGENSDFYFSDLPSDLFSNGFSSQIALINHTPFKSFELGNKWESKQIPRIIFHNYIGVFKELQMLFVSLILSVKLYLSISLKRKELDNRILFNASLKAFDCIPNLRLGYQVEQIVKKVKPKYIITTYEGHSLERIIFAMARKAYPNIKCIGYQHALVFKLQHAIRRNLAPIYNPDIIFTSGAIGKKQLENSKTLNGVKIDTLGSNRGFKMANEIKLENQIGNKSTCLVIPEALAIECELLFNLSLQYALKNENINFIWRLHPLMNFESLLKANPIFNNLPGNITLSEKSFEEDISNSEFVLYRGSTAVVKAVLSGLSPIYYSQENEMTIDPLYEKDKGKHVITNVYDLNLVFGMDLKKEDHSELINYCKSLFTELNVYKLVELN